VLSRMDVLEFGEQVGFRQDLVRTAVLAALPDAARGALEVRTARVLLDRCAPASAVAAHPGRAGTPVREEWAVGGLWSAAPGAAAQGGRGEGRPEQALAALRRLLAEPHESLARARYLAELGVLEVYEDPGTAVEHLSAALSRLDDPAAVARVACRLAGALVDSAAPAEAGALPTAAVTRGAPP